MANDDERELYKQAQRRLVASLLCGDEAGPQALENVNEDDFEEPSLGIIFNAAAEVLREGNSVSAISIAERLDSQGELEQAGGVTELYSLRSQGEKYLTEAPITVYSRIVREYSAKSKLHKRVKEAALEFTPDSGVLASDGIAQLQADLNEVLYRLADSESTSTSTDLSDEFMDILEERREIAEENRESAGGLQGIPTSLPSLNEYTTGWLKGQLITVGAQTSIGKSVFAINTMVAAAQAGKSVLFFSLEMGRHEVENRIVSSTTGVPLNTLKQGGTTAEENARIKKGLEDISEMKFMIDTDPEMTVDSIRAKALKKAQSPEGLDMIVIDYLQLLTPSRKTSNRQEAVAEISRGIKLLAKSLGVPIVIVVQLTRPNKDQEDTTPNKYDIRESGAIANDSDVVLLLHRPDTEDGSIPHTRVILDKNRDGVAHKTILCHSDLECSAFREITRAESTSRVSDDDLEDLGEEFAEFDSDLGDPDDLSELDDFGDTNEEVDF